MGFRAVSSGVITPVNASTGYSIPRPTQVAGDVIYAFLGVVGNSGSIPITPPATFIVRGASDSLTANGAAVTAAVRMYRATVGVGDPTSDTWTTTAFGAANNGTSIAYVLCSYELTGALVGYSDTFAVSNAAPTYTDDEFVAGVNGAMAGLPVAAVYGMAQTDSVRATAGTEKDYDDPTFTGLVKTFRGKAYTGLVTLPGLPANTDLKLWMFDTLFTADGSGTQEQTSITYDPAGGGFNGRRHYFGPIVAPKAVGAGQSPLPFEGRWRVTELPYQITRAILAGRG